MSGSRLLGRLRVLRRAAARAGGARKRPDDVKSILVAHNLLAGDVFMLAPLLAKARARHPRARIVMTVRPSILPLLSGRPYGVEPVAFDPRNATTLDAVFDRQFDLALVPGDNRYSWLAAAAGAKWIVAFGGDRPRYKSWPVDEEVAFPDTPASWPDMAALLVDGEAPTPYRAGDWPAPDAAAVALPKAPFVVLHVGAGSPLRLWPAARWRELAQALEARGLAVAWSAGPGEERLVEEIDPDGRQASYAGRVDLAQLWHVLAGARGLFTLDTSVAHLAKLVGVRTVALFGPGSPVLFGKGAFWRGAPFEAVGPAEFPCRDQRSFFKREVHWIRRCQRSAAECEAPRCMHAIELAHVLEAADNLGIHAR